MQNRRHNFHRAARREKERARGGYTSCAGRSADPNCIGCHTVKPGSYEFTLDEDMRRQLQRIWANQTNQDELARYRHHLEELVSARTVELAQARDDATQ